MSRLLRSARSLRCRLLGHRFRWWAEIDDSLGLRNVYLCSRWPCQGARSYFCPPTERGLSIEQRIAQRVRAAEERVIGDLFRGPRAGTAATAPPALTATVSTASAPPPDPLYVTETGEVVSWSSDTAEGRHESGLWIGARAVGRG